MLWSGSGRGSAKSEAVIRPPRSGKAELTVSTIEALQVEPRHLILQTYAVMISQYHDPRIKWSLSRHRRQSTRGVRQPAPHRGAGLPERQNDGFGDSLHAEGLTEARVS